MSELTPEHLEEIRGVLDGSLRHVGHGNTDWLLAAMWELLDHIEMQDNRLREREARGHECYATCCGGCPVCHGDREVCVEHSGRTDDCPDRCGEGNGAPVMECPRCVGKY
jgi:hypothetical protein